MLRRALPLLARPFDLVIIAFFIINLLFITYIVVIEQLIIADRTISPIPFGRPRRLALAHAIYRSRAASPAASVASDVPAPL